MTEACVAVVLPPNEGFSPASVGAIGLVVQRFGAHPGSGFRTVVIGAPPTHLPFEVPAFAPARMGWWPPFARGRRYAVAVARHVRTLRPALIEVHNRPLLAHALARRFATTPTMLVLHNDPQGMRGSRSVGDRARLRAAVHVVAVSAYVRARFMDGLDPAGPMPTVVAHGLDLNALPPPRPAAGRERLILFVGRLVAEKGADCFIAGCARALPGLPGWRAEMIGARHLRPDSLPDAYAVAVAQSAATGGVTLHGHLPHAAVLEAMAQAAIVVVPSRWDEPFGLTALEAMACGAALICAPRGNLTQLAGGAAVLIEPEDVSAMAAAIAELAADAHGRAALGAAGLARAAHYGADAAAEALRVLRERVIGQSQGRCMSAIGRDQGR